MSTATQAGQAPTATNGRAPDGATQAQAQATLPFITLAGLAACSGLVSDTVADQEAYCQAAINAQLADANLATGGAWSVIWLALSDNPANDLANLVYIAQNTRASIPTYAVVIRGTLPGDRTDVIEDMDVSTVKSFSSFVPLAPKPQLGGGCDEPNPMCISSGALEAFTNVTAATSGGATLKSKLMALAAAAGDTQILIYVAGHSLGGATATTIALNLAWGFSWAPAKTPLFQVYTFAGPSAGLSGFADLFNTTFGGDASTPNNSFQVNNAYDAVPTAWVTADMEAIKTWYPGGPQVQDAPNLVKDINKAIALPGVRTYVQPSVNPMVLNSGSTPLLGPGGGGSTESQCLAEVGFQHANNTYIYLLATLADETTIPWITQAPGRPGALTAEVRKTIDVDPDKTYVVFLKWTAPAPDPESVNGAPSGAPDSYKVFRSTTSGSGYSLVGTVTAAITEYLEAGLQHGTIYYYVVQAVNGSGASAPSAEVTVTSPGPES